MPPQPIWGRYFSLSLFPSDSSFVRLTKTNQHIPHPSMPERCRSCVVIDSISQRSSHTPVLMIFLPLLCDLPWALERSIDDALSHLNCFTYIMTFWMLHSFLLFPIENWLWFLYLFFCMYIRPFFTYFKMCLFLSFISFFSLYWHSVRAEHYGQRMWRGRTSHSIDAGKQNKAGSQRPGTNYLQRQISSVQDLPPTTSL